MNPFKKILTGVGIVLIIVLFANIIAGEASLVVLAKHISNKHHPVLHVYLMSQVIILIVISIVSVLAGLIWLDNKSKDNII